MSVYRFSDPSTKLTILIRASGTKITPINGATSVFESEAIDDPKLIFDAFDLLLIRTEDPLVLFFKKKLQTPDGVVRNIGYRLFERSFRDTKRSVHMIRG